MDINQYVFSCVKNENKATQDYIFSNFFKDLKSPIDKISLMNNAFSLENFYIFLDHWIRLQINYSKEILEKVPSALNFKRVGDYHNQQRSTVIIQSKDKETFIYKPISPISLLLMNEIYSILKPDFDFKQLRIINNWNDAFLAEFLYDDQENFDAKKYSYHYGALSLLAYIFKITDLHQENILTFNSVPIIIDAETLFYPAIEGLQPFSFKSTLLFPSRFNTRSPFQNISNFDRKAFLNGMEVCEQLFLQNKKEIIECIEKYRAHLKTRIIFKPTHYYIQLINNSLHPEFLINEDSRIKYIQASLQGNHKITASIARYELGAIKQLDVPYFVADSQGQIEALNDQKVDIFFTPYSFTDSLLAVKAMSTEISAQIASFD
jgi:lantibiotic modifying enzyme